MKKVIALLLMSILLCSVVLIPMSSSITASAKASTGVKEGYVNEDKWLSLSKNTTGPRYFVDSKGNPVRLFGQARVQSFASHEDLLCSDVSNKDATLEFYANYGCNFTRLAIKDPSYMSSGKKPTSAEIQEFITKNVDPDVQAIIRNGLYVMLDIHMYTPTSNTSFEQMKDYAIGYFRPLAVELAKRYKDEPMVAVIELWNEPVAADNQNVPYEKEVWTNFIREYFIDTVNEVRKYDTRHVLMVSDHNAGWGGAHSETWAGWHDKVDPVYRNTCYSIHAGYHEFVKDDSYEWYRKTWFSWAEGYNVCLLFGEIETEPGNNTDHGMENYLKLLSESVDRGAHFSTAIWRPHGGDYKELWGESGWAKKYASPAPKPTARYASETEDLYGEKDSSVMELLNEADLFGRTTGTGVSMKPNLKATQYYEPQNSTELADNIIYKEGKYKLIVRACGKKGYEGDFIVGYRDIDGVVHQIARFGGKNTNGEHYYQSIDFTANKKIASFVYFSCETSKKSAIIDRVYIIGTASSNETSSRLKATINDVSKVIDLSGKSYTISTTNNKPSDNNTETKPDDKDDASSNNDVSDDNNSNQSAENSGNTDNSQNEQTTTTKTETTNSSTEKEEGSDGMIYVWIGIGLAVLFAAFIVICVIVVKKRNKAET